MREYGFFSNPYFPIYRTNRRFCPYTEKCESEKNPYSGIFYVKISKLDPEKYGSKTVNVTEFR